MYIAIAVSFWYDSSIWGGMHFQTCFWAFSSRQNSAQVLLVMVVKHLKDIVSKTEKANLQPFLVAFPFQQQRIATQQKTICTFMVSYMYIYCVLCPTLQWNWIASMKMLFLEVCRIWIHSKFRWVGQQL